MTDNAPEQSLEQAVAAPSRDLLAKDEILLLLARRYQEHDQSLLQMGQVIERIGATLDRTALLQEQNTIAIAELRAILRERYNGNGQSGD